LISSDDWDLGGDTFDESFSTSWNVKRGGLDCRWDIEKNDIRIRKSVTMSEVE
jgi:hypothetical protein